MYHSFFFSLYTNPKRLNTAWVYLTSSPPTWFDNFITFLKCVFFCVMLIDCIVMQLNTKEQTKVYYRKLWLLSFWKISFIEVDWSFAIFLFFLFVKKKVHLKNVLMFWEIQTSCHRCDVSFVRENDGSVRDCRVSAKLFPRWMQLLEKCASNQGHSKCVFFSSLFYSHL